MVALIREPPRDEGPARRISLRSSRDEVDVSAIARAAGGGGHRQAAGFSSELVDPRDRRRSCAASSRRSRTESLPPRGLRPIGIALVDKPAGPSSFAIVATLRRRTRARTGHAGTLDPFATGLLVLLSGAATRLAPCFVGLDKRYRHRRRPDGDDDRPAIRRARWSSAMRRRRDDELDAAVERLRGEVELPIPAASAVKIGGERAYKLARRGVEVEMPVRRSTVHSLDRRGLRRRPSSGCRCTSARVPTSGRWRRRSAVTARRFAEPPSARSRSTRQTAIRGDARLLAVGRRPGAAARRRARAGPRLGARRRARGCGEAAPEGAA